MRALTLILSESEFLAAAELERTRAYWERKGYAVEEVAAEDPQAVTYALDTQSLFGDGRFVVIRGPASALDAIGEHLAAWAEHPPTGIAAAVVAARAAKLKKVLGARADVIEATAPKPWETADWLVRHVKGAGRSMSKDGAAALVEALGADLRELATAAEQVMTATRGSIGPDAVARMFRGMEAQLYTFLDALVQRDRAGSLRHLGALLRGGEYHPLVLTATLAKQFRAIAAARDAARQPAAVLAKELDLTVGYVNRAYKHGRNFAAEDIRGAFRAIADADDTLKGGERGTDYPDHIVVELLVSELCGEPASAVRRG